MPLKGNRSRSWFVVRYLIVLVLGLALLFAAGAVLFYKLVLYNAPVLPEEELPIEKKMRITIPKGSTLRETAVILEESRVISDHRLFILAAKYLRAEKQIKAGSYLLPLHASNYQIISILRQTKPQSIRVTIPEGISLSRMLVLFRKHLPLDADSFSYALRDTKLIRSLGMPDTSLFGYLMPNTYYLDPGINEQTIVRLMVEQFLLFFNDDLKKRASHLGLSVRQVVTLASIIEGETADDEERYLVSAVYHNRLKKGMLLQADPTIQFITGDLPRRLYLKDLEIDHPYNTYKYKGLPPGPINNPGKASILAALYPAQVNYLYMVADGKGRHIFSTTMQDHLRAKQKLDQLRRKLEQKKR